MRLSNLLGRAADVLYPPRCVGCGAFDEWLCRSCDESMTPTSEGERCGNCSGRWSGALNCPRCFHCDSLERLVGVYDMDGVTRQLVHGLKYRGVMDLAETMAGRMRFLQARHDFDVALSVPLHPSRQKRRGFNQAEEIVRRLGWPVVVGGSLVRRRKTDTQVGMHARERRNNVSGAFEWRGASLRGQRVAIVDDVITTGATVNECASVLREHGARSVFALAFARASYDPHPGAVVVD